MWGKLLGRLMDFVYPKGCVGCGRLGNWLCDECKSKLDEVEQVCPMCGKNNLGGNVHKMCSKREGMDGLTAVYDHGEQVMRRMINRVKFEFNRELLAELVSRLDFKIGKKFDAIVPMPLYRYRKNWRGFNQAGVIAEEVSRQLNLPLVEALKRIKGTKQQSKIKNRKDRSGNVKGVFSIDSGQARMTDKSINILLVDDVFTSGATMREATKTLKRAGVKFVWGLTLCRQV